MLPPPGPPLSAVEESEGVVCVYRAPTPGPSVSAAYHVPQPQSFTQEDNVWKSTSFRTAQLPPQAHHCQVKPANTSVIIHRYHKYLNANLSLHIHQSNVCYCVFTISSASVTVAGAPKSDSLDFKEMSLCLFSKISNIISHFKGTVCKICEICLHVVGLLSSCFVYSHVKMLKL